MNRTKPHVSLRGVTKSFGQAAVVKDLSLDIYNGEFLTILGPSGSGKTTCLMLLAGFESADAGAIIIDGQYVNSIPPHKRGIGLVFQNYALFPHMTVAENLAFPLKVRKLGKAAVARRVEEMLALVKLGEFGGRFPAQLSGGQQQRVALARALIFRPQLVLMDEPLGALDKQLRERMQYEIKRLHEEFKSTVVYVTHDQAEALVLSDRVAVFNEGGIQQIGEPDAVYESPANAFTAGFIGENNIFRGSLLQVYEDTCAVEIESGNRLQGMPIGLARDASRVTVAIRPERILINPGSDCYNILTGRIRQLIYLGDYMRTVVGLPRGCQLAVKSPNDRGKLDLAVGQEVKVGWYPEDCRVFAA